MYKILAIDDEPNNLIILDSYLSDCGYLVELSSGGRDAWDKLQANPTKYDVILLDRMMPELGGMELLAMIKADATLKNIPIIMQTAAAEKSQISEGIAAGVYHYLTKPFSPDILLAIVRSAINDYLEYQKLAIEIDKFRDVISLSKSGTYEFSSLDDARKLSSFIAAFYPEPEAVLLGVAELLINAVEHGNLDISYAEKTQLNIAGIWQNEINRRAVLPEYKDKIVQVECKYFADKVVLRIKDQGNGFKWQNYLDIDPARAEDSHGRGIAMAKMLSFDNITYLGNGNEVICEVFLSHSELVSESI